MESLFTGTGKQRLSNILQTLLYAMMLHRSRGCDVEPALYYVRNMNRPGYSPQLDDKQTGVKGARYTLYRERFEERCARSSPNSTTPRFRSASARMPIPASTATST